MTFSAAMVAVKKQMGKMYNIIFFYLKVSLNVKEWALGDNILFDQAKLINKKQGWLPIILTTSFWVQ